jgi:hypothetical protein
VTDEQPPLWSKTARAARSPREEAARCGRALLLLSSIRFKDDLVRSIEGAIARIEAGQSLNYRGFGDVALLSRVRDAVTAPTLPRLRALWVLVGYWRHEDLRAELSPLVVAWRDAGSRPARARAAADLRAWFERRSVAIAHSLHGPFDERGQPSALRSSERLLPGSTPPTSTPAIAALAISTPTPASAASPVAALRCSTWRRRRRRG